MERVGVDDFTFHGLRHTFVTRLAQRGEDLYRTCKLLGHKDIKTTQRYAHHCPESLRAGVEMLETDCNMTAVERKAVISGDRIRHKSLGNKVLPVGVEPTTH